MDGKISNLPSVILEHLAELLSRNCTEWTLLGHLFELYAPISTQILVERIARHNYTAQELCLELLKELATNRISLQVLVDALKKLGLLGLANKISPIAQGQVFAQWIYLLSSFEQKNKTSSNSHVILFPNLDDEEIAKIASKMKMEVTLGDTEDIMDGDKTVGLTIHWLETNAPDVKTTIALVNNYGKMDKAWPIFLRQFGKPPNISIVQFYEDNKNHIIIPETIATPTSKTHLCRIDPFLVDYWQQNINENCRARHESHAEISIEKSLVPDSNLQSILQYVGDVEDKVLLRVGAKDKEFMIDQVACFLQCWTAGFDANINTSRTVIAQMSFDEQYPDRQIAIPTDENGHVILSRFSADDSTIVIFATTIENYWRLWINYPDIKLYKNQGWTLASMTPVSKKFVDELRQIADVPIDLIESLSFFTEEVEKININIKDYLDAELLNTRTRGTTFFRHVGSNSQKELVAKDVEVALNKAWPKEDYNTKPAKLEALLNFFNLVPSDKTHDGLNNAWKNARQQMQAYSELERLTLTEEPITAWYSNWLWTTIKKSLKLRTIVVPQTKLIPNVLVVNALKQIPDYITLEFSCLDINTKVIINSLVNKTIVIKTIMPGPIKLPDPKLNRITVECVQLVDDDTSIFEAVLLDTYRSSRPTVMLPTKLMDYTSVMIDVCQKLSNAGTRAQSQNFLWLYEVVLESENAEKFKQAYPLIPQPITAQSIINYFDNVKANNLDFTVDYEAGSKATNLITLCAESVEAALQLKKHLIVKEVETGKQVDSQKIFVVQSKLMIECSSGKFYSIRRQISGFAPSAEIVVPTCTIKLMGNVYPDMSQPAKRQMFLENAKKLDLGNGMPLCYFCKSPIQGNFDLINVVPWAKFEYSPHETVLPVHEHCNTAHEDYLISVVLQPKSFSFPLSIRALSFNYLLPAVDLYIWAAEVRLESKYDNLDVTTVLKMEELEYHMEDEDWRKLSDQFLGLLLTTHEYDVVDKSLVNQVPSQTKIDGTYLGQDVFIKAMPAKNTIRELFWLRVSKFPSIVQFLGYYYENEHTSHLIFEKLKYDLSAIKLESTKKEVRMRIARQLCAAMAFLHNKGITRRSLKPSHILLDEQYNAKLVCSNLQTDLPEVGYSPPQVIKNGDGSISKESDVYAFGILLLELATTKNAWEGRSNKQIMETVKNGWFPESLTKIDMKSELYQLISKCLDKEPAQRPSFVKIQLLLRNDKLTDTFC